ncbi:MAG: histone deacetylase [Tenacibaculum sp.]
MLKIAYHKIYKHPLPDKHRFPMQVYELLAEQLLFEGSCVSSNFFIPSIAHKKHFLRVHTLDYFQALICRNLSEREVRRIGFPLSQQLIDREMIIADGTIKATNYALEYGIAMNIAGGTHHAFTNRGEGFCMLNDQAVAARYAQKQKGVGKILILDLDVHQGNGSAQIFKADPSVFTFSMHGKNNYPFFKEQSDLDIELQNGIKDQEYLSILKATLPKLISQEQPKLIFYQCGVDILQSDALGKLSLSLNGCKERDRIVLQSCYNNKIPVVCCMGGGYSKDIKIIVEAHANTFRLAQEIYF